MSIARPRWSLLALLAAASLLLAMALQSGPTAQARGHLTAAPNGSWTTYHRDDGHTGNDSSVPALSSVSTGWVSTTLDQQVYAEPLVYNGLVYVATLNDSVYALDQATGAIVWAKNLGTPKSSGWGCGNVSPQGILGTPVIDAAGGRIYVTVLFADSTYHVIGLALTDGTKQMDTTLNIPGFDWTIQQERGALALHGGYVYVPFGGRDGDCGAYHGYVVAVPTNGGANLPPFQTAGSGNSIWGAGGPAIDDTTGNVFVSTGQGACTLGQNDQVIRLSSTATFQEYFTPADWASICGGTDQDLGSAGPMLISPNLLFQAGKGGGGYLLDPNHLGGADGQLYPPQTNYTQADVCLGNHADATFGSFAYAAPFIYVECNGRGLVALNTNTAAPSFTPCGSSCGAPDWTAGGSATFGPPIVAGGAVWVIDTNGGGLYAFDAGTGAQLFHSAAFGAHHFVTPAEAGGQVFVPSNNVIREFSMNFNFTLNSLGGLATTGPGSSSWGSARADVFVGGTDSGIWQQTWNGTSWQGWSSLGGIITTDPAAASWGVNRIDLFVGGSGNALYHRWWDGTGWSGWENLGGTLTSGPGDATRGVNTVDVFVRGTDNGLWHRWWDSAGWHGWEALGGVLTSDPGSVAESATRLDVAVRGTDNGLWFRYWDSTGWHGWASLGGYLTSAPALSSCTAGTVDAWVLGSNGALWRRTFTGGAWGSWQFEGGQWTNKPSATCRPGTTSTDVYVRGLDGSVWHLGF